MLHSYKSIGFAFGLLATAELSNAEPIKLVSSDGELEVVGDLIGYDGENYRLGSRFGDLTIRDDNLICIGLDCPSRADRVAELSIIGQNAPLERLLPELVETYGLINGGQLTTEQRPTGEVKLHITDAFLEKVAEISLIQQQGSLAFAKLEEPESSFLLTTKARKLDGQESAALDQPIVTNKPSSDDILALDAAAVIVSPENPIESISLAKLDRILRGRTTNWRSLGAPTAPITIYMPEDLPDLLESFPYRALSTSKSNYISDIRYLRNDASVAEAVAADPFGIGFTRFSALQDAKAVAITTKCGLVSAPSAFSIKSGEYPLGYTYYLKKPKARQAPFVRGFVKFLNSDLSQSVIQDAGFVDLAPVSSDINEQGLRLSHAISTAGSGVDLPDLQRMAQILNGAQRLSTTFRFEGDGKSLDARSERYARSLIQGIQNASFTNKQVFLIGFSDSSGPADMNENLSLKRAQSVLELLQKAVPDGSLDQIDIQAFGFGETSPVGCNDTKQGKQLNRRVEVWIKDRG